MHPADGDLYSCMIYLRLSYAVQDYSPNENDVRRIRDIRTAPRALDVGYLVIFPRLTKSK